MTIVQAEQPSYRPLQALAMPFSAATMSVKIRLASSRGLYATKIGHASAATPI